MKVLLDTNFLIDVFRFKIDIDQIYDLAPGAEIFVLSSVLDELERLASKSSTNARPAKVALQFSRSLPMEQSATHDADEAILLAKPDIVATNDRELRKKLHERGVKTIYVRARKHLAID